MGKPIIVVLEDTAERVEWLKSQCGDGIDVSWHMTASAFISCLNDMSSDDVRLIILDHDLGDAINTGNDTWPRDIEGNDGMTAVKHLDERWSSVPIIVWSWNPPASDAMVAELRDRGFSCMKIPFNPGSWALLKAILGSHC